MTSSRMALSSAALTRSTIGFGVPFGKNRAVHAMVCRSGKPASVEEGTLGMAAARLGVVTAIAFTPPARMCGVAETT